MEKTLIQKLEMLRAERPSEWMMDELIRDAKELEKEREEAQTCCLEAKRILDAVYDHKDKGELYGVKRVISHIRYNFKELMT